MMRNSVIVLITLMLLSLSPLTRATEEAERGASAESNAQVPREGVVRAGMVVVGEAGVSGSEMDVCFAEGFLTTLARETDIDVHRQLERTTLADDEVFDYPFLVLAGQGAFTLSAQERERLDAYVRRGGFVLASAGCTNAAWAASFAEVAAAVFGEDALQALSTDHPLFHTVYEIDHVDVRVGDPDRAVLGYEVDGVVRLVFSPVGLNATDQAGGGCCCCGGDEVRNARLINTNILAYALTR